MHRRILLTIDCGTRAAAVLTHPTDLENVSRLARWLRHVAGRQRHMPHGRTWRAGVPLSVLRRLRARCLVWLVAALPSMAVVRAEPVVPILVYHRFGTTATDSMTVRVETFDAQLRVLRERGYRVVPLADVLAWMRGERPLGAPLAVAITADDGHRSVYELMRPIAYRERLPVTLFIYPSAISNASYAMTWEQLRTLRQSGLFDLQSHTYWHPDFRVERRRLAPPDYRRFVNDQLVRSRERIGAETGAQATLLAWPFGIFDSELMGLATAAGYAAAFTLEGRAAARCDAPLAIPRILVSDSDDAARFGRMLDAARTAATRCLPSAPGEVAKR